MIGGKGAGEAADARRRTEKAGRRGQDSEAGGEEAKRRRISQGKAAGGGEGEAEDSESNREASL